MNISLHSQPLPLYGETVHCACSSLVFDISLILTSITTYWPGMIVVECVQRYGWTWGFEMLTKMSACGQDLKRIPARAIVIID